MSKLPEKVKASEFFKSAINKTTKGIEIDFKVEGKEYKGVLSNVDKVQLWHHTEKLKLELMQEAEPSGDFKKPIVESEWESFLSKITNPKSREYWEKNKPQNLAEQLVNKMTDIRIIVDMFPKFLKIYDSNGKEIDTSSKEDQESIRQLIANDFAIMGKMTKAYAELITRTSEIEEEVKNLSEEDIAISSVNSSPSQTDTDSPALSTKD